MGPTITCEYCATVPSTYLLEIVHERLMFLLRSSAVDGTYSLALDFRLPTTHCFFALF